MHSFVHHGIVPQVQDKICAGASHLRNPWRSLRQNSKLEQRRAGRAFRAAGRDVEGIKKPYWVKDLEEDAPYDEDAAKVLEGTGGDPKKIRENMRKSQNMKLEEILQSRVGDSLPMRVFFREVNPFDLWIWFEFHENPSPSDKEMLSGVLRAWFMVGKLGGFNASNLQVSRNGEDDISYFEYDFEDSDENKLESFLHEMTDIEFQDNEARFRLDMGTADEMAIDCLINMLSTFSEEHCGIKKLFVGGENQDWEVPKLKEEDPRVKGLMDIAAMAKEKVTSASTSGLSGKKIKIGGESYTVEDIPKF